MISRIIQAISKRIDQTRPVLLLAFEFIVEIRDVESV